MNEPPFAGSVTVDEQGRRHATLPYNADPALVEMVSGYADVIHFVGYGEFTPWHPPTRWERLSRWVRRRWLSLRK